MRGIVGHVEKTAVAMLVGCSSLLAGELASFSKSVARTSQPSRRDRRRAPVSAVEPLLYALPVHASAAHGGSQLTSFVSSSEPCRRVRLRFRVNDLDKPAAAYPRLEVEEAALGR